MLRKIIGIDSGAALLPIKNTKAPFAITPDGKWLRFGDKRIERRTTVPYQVIDRVPGLKKWLDNLVMDQAFVKSVFATLTDFKAGAVALAEGETAAAKTTGFVFIAAMLNLPFFRVNHSDQIDPGDILGRHVPNSAVGQGQLFKLIHSEDISALDPESQQIIAASRFEKNGRTYMNSLSETNLHRIAELEKISLPKTPFTEALGPLPESAIYGGLYLADELNLAPADRQSLYNPVFEDSRKIRIPGFGRTLSRFASGIDKVSKWFQIGAAQNPAGSYGMRNKQPADLLGRVSKREVDAPSMEGIKNLITFLTFGVQPNIKINNKSYIAEARLPQFPKLTNKDMLPFYGLLAKFHHELQVKCASNILNRNRKQKLTFTRRDIITFLRFLSDFESFDRETEKTYNFQNNPVETFFRGIDLFYTSRFKLDPGDQQEMAKMKLNTFGVIDKEIFLTTNGMFGNNFYEIEHLFVNPYSDNLILKENAKELFDKIALPTKLDQNLRELIEKTSNAKRSDTELLLDFLREQHKPRKLSTTLRPVIEKSADGKYLFIHDLRIDIRNDLTPDEQKLVPDLDKEGRLCLDKQTVRLLTNIAIAHKYDIPLLIEGLPATTKTSGVVYFSGLINQPVHRINFNGRTNPGDVIGKYVPSDQTLAERYSEIVSNYQNLVLTEETVQIIETALHSARILTEDEAKKIAALEGLWIPQTSWVYRQEDLVMSNRTGHTAVWDELNQAETNVGERFNSLIERPKSFVLSEHNSESLTEDNGGIHPMSRNFATGNPAEFPGKKIFSPAAINRWSMYLQINNVSELELDHMLHYLIYGIQPEIDIDGVKYSAEVEQTQFKSLARLENTDNFLKKLSEFHYGLCNQVHPIQSKRTLAKDDPDLLITRRELIAILKRIETDELVETIIDSSGSANLDVKNVYSDKATRKRIITDAIEDVYLSKFTEDSREEVRGLLNAAGLSFDYWAFNEIAEKMSPEKAAIKLNKEYGPKVAELDKFANKINTSPSETDINDEMNATRKLISQLQEHENNIQREMHKYDVEPEKIKELMSAIDLLRTRFTEASDLLNQKEDQYLDDARDKIAKDLADVLKDFESSSIFGED